MSIKSFSLRVDSNGTQAMVYFMGMINEDAYADYFSLSETLPQNCTFDFSGVGFINSCGIRDWIKFIRHFQKDRTVRFERCTDSLVGNIGLMPYMLGTATLASVLRNCTCPKCNAIDAVLLTANSDYDKEGNLLIPIPNCKRCGTEISWDIPDSDYFVFLNP